MFCKHCGCEISEETAVCPKCGTQREDKKFCQHCGAVIDKDCVVCPQCGRQVAELKQQQQSIVINNTNNNQSSARADVRVSANGREKNKWVAFCLCLFLGFLGAHKFYEGKVGMGILYIITFGLFCIGWIVDLIAILAKPNPYYV